MAFTPEQQREHRKKLKEQGICTVCHKGQAVAGTPTCQGCKDKSKARRIARMEGGKLCKYCTRPRSVGNICRVCADSRNQQRRNRRKRWVSEGKCGNCGGMMDDPTKHDCINCQDIRTHYKRLARSWV